jgi:hypothetical protein
MTTIQYTVVTSQTVATTLPPKVTTGLKEVVAILWEGEGKCRSVRE